MEVKSGARAIPLMFKSCLSSPGRVLRAIYLAPVCLSSYTHKVEITTMIMCHMVVVGVNKFTNVST